MSNVRLVRNQFLSGIGPSSTNRTLTEDRTCAIRCSQLAAAAAALSCVTQLDCEDTAQQLAADVPLAVTVDSLLVNCGLPLHYMWSRDTPTIQETHAIMSHYMDGDVRFEGFTTDLELCDLKILEVLRDPLTEFDSAQREVAVDASTFRQRLIDSQNSKSAVIVFYDKQTLEDSWTVDEEDETSNLALSFRKAVLNPVGAGEAVSSQLGVKAREPETDCAVVVGITRDDRVQLAIPKFSDARAGMTIADVSLAVLHRGMATRSVHTQRADGFIVVRRSAQNPPPLTLPRTLGSQATNAGDDKSPTPEAAKSPRISPRKRPFYGQLAQSERTHLSDPQHSFPLYTHLSVGTHITAVAQAFALLQDASHAAIDVNRLCRAVGIPADMLSRVPLSLAVVEAQCRSFAAELELDYRIGAVRFAKPLLKSGAAVSLSVSTFGRILASLKTLNHRRAAAVMMVCINPGFCHWIVDSAGDGEDQHWVLVGQFNEETETVDVIETQPRKYGSSWSVDIEQLHRAMTNLGFVIVALPNVDIAPLMGDEEVDGTCAMPPRKFVSPLVHARGVEQAAFAGAPLSLLPLALNSLCNTNLTFSALLHKSPISLTHMMIDHLSAYDLSRVLRDFVVASATSVSVHEHSFVFSLMSGVSPIEARAMFDDLLERAHSGECEVVFNFHPRDLPIEATRPRAAPTDFALFQGKVGDSVLMMDSNVHAGLRRWAVPADDLFDAVCKFCPLSGRPVAAVELRRAAQLTPNEAAKACLPSSFGTFSTPALEPFRGSAAALVSAVAMAFTSFGVACTPETVLYKAFRNADAAVAQKLFPSRVLTSQSVELARDIVGCLRNATGFIKSAVVAEEPSTSIAAAADALSENQRIILLYRASLLHENSDELGLSAALVRGVTGGRIAAIDARPTSFPAEWSREVSEVEASMQEDGCGFVVLTSRPENE